MRDAFGLEVVDDLAVLLQTPLPLVEAAGLQELDVVEARHRFGHLVAEVLVLRPRDRTLGDALHARRGVRDLDLLRAFVVVAAPNPPRVQQVGPDRVRREQLEDPVALQAVRQREEGVRAGDPQELAGLGRASGGGAGRLAEHEVGGGLLLIELGDRGDEVLVPVEDQQVVHAPDVHRVAEPGEVVHAEHRAPVLRVALLEEVHLAVFVLVHVLEVGRRLDDRVVDVGLEVGIEAERLREASVLGPVGLAAGHERDEIVLHGQRVVLRRERRGGLPGAREPDDHEHLLAGGRRDDLQAGVEGQAAEVVDLRVPHPQAALLRLAEVVGVQDAGHAVLEIDRDHAVVRVAGRLEVRRVDLVGRRITKNPVAIVAREVELLLHPGDVRVRLLDREARPRPEGRIVADEAVDHDDVLVAEVVVLEPGDLLERLTGHRLSARAFRDHVRAAGAPRRDPGLDVHVAEPRDPALRHRLGEAAELVRGRVVVDRACLDLQRSAPSSGKLASSGTLGAALSYPRGGARPAERRSAPVAPKTGRRTGRRRGRRTGLRNRKGPMELSEDELIKAVARLLSGSEPGVVVGVGDDAAVVEPGAGQLVLTTDLLAEGVHFERGSISARDLGAKAITVNVSDVAAMAASPRYALVAIAAPGDVDAAWVVELVGGMRDACAEYALALVGGDTNRADLVVVSVAVVGEVAPGRAVLRSGARVGDRIVVTGSLGAAAGGLALSRAAAGRAADALSQPWGRSLIQALERPIARVGEAQVLARVGATAMMDLSDGLSTDVSRLCEASGVGARIVLGAVPVAETLSRGAELLEVDVSALALSGGEDYELLATLPADAVDGAREDLRSGFDVALSEIGEIVAGSGVVAVDV